MFRITYQVNTWLAMSRMGHKEWLECLQKAKAIVAEVRRELRAFAETGDKAHKAKADAAKRSLPGACFQAAEFAVSVGTKTYNKGKRGRWREQRHAFLSGLVVIDVDHVDNPREVFERIRAEHDLKELGILLVYVSASGEGLKIVFRARAEWGNLICNQYEMASRLGVLDYVDDACKDSSRLSFLTGPDDVLYCDEDTLFEDDATSNSDAGEVVRTDYDLHYGDRYRKAPKGDSSPTVQTWMDFEAERSNAKRKKSVKKPSAEAAKQPEVTPQIAPEGTPSTAFTERQQAIIKALNEYYGERLGEGQKHPTFCQETSHWLCWLADNDPQQAIAMAYALDWVKDWQPLPGEVEDLIQSAASKKLLKRTPKQLTALLEKAGIDKDTTAAGSAEDDLPFDEWVEQIRALFDVYPCLREVCEPHPERLWPFLLFASSALMGTLMTLCWYRFYDQPEQRRRLNYNVLGIGDPASGKGALVRIASILTEPIERADQLANDAINAWKEDLRSKGSNKDKSPKPKGIIRLHGARTSNNVFINDMINSWTMVDGEREQLHMLTVDTEAINSIKMQKGGSWIDKQVMEIKAFSNEKDSQQYSNLDSVMAFFDVFWNLVRTCTPSALKQLVNDRNFGTGYPTRLAALPVPGTGFKMMELRKQSQQAVDADQTLRQWAYKLDKRQGELPLWPLVEHCWHWTDNRMDIAAFNNDKADEMLLKRCAYYGICISAPYIDMRHWDEREQTGTYEIDDTDRSLCDLVLDIQYRTQHHFFGELARNYFEEQMLDATQFRRRTTRFEQCFLRLPEVFTTELFAQIFGYANNRSASKTLERFLKDKAIVRIKRGEYRKRVQSIG